MIKIENLVKKYGNFTAVNDISFTVNPGEIFGFLGINGAGKTTTLKILAGILQPTSGSVSICEHNLLKEPEKAKAITGYIPDRPYLYNKLTGREFLYFCADLYRVKPALAEERMAKLLETYSLTEWQDELVESYSHGMKQRLATCSALIHAPQVMIIDEPMVGLDPHGAKLLKESMRRYASEGMSIILSTHSLNVAEEVSDRIAIINRGNIITTGTVDEIKHEAGNPDSNLESVFIELTSGG